MIHYLKDAFEYDADDLQWFKVAGGYLSHKVKVPPMGKYNPGQKLYYLAIVGAGIAIAALRLRHLVPEGQHDADAPFAPCS